MFNEDTFMETSIAAAGDTELPAAPDGEYVAEITKIIPKALDPKADDPEQKPRAMLRVMWATEDEAATKVVGLPKVSMGQLIMLDINDDGSLDMSKGKNTRLNKLRDVFGQNTSSAWSPAMLIGQRALVRSQQEEYQGRVNSNVVNVAPLG